MTQGIFPLVVELEELSGERRAQSLDGVFLLLQKFHQAYPATPIHLIVPDSPDKIGDIEEIRQLPCQIHIRADGSQAERHPAHLLITHAAAGLKGTSSANSPLPPSVPNLPVPIDSDGADSNPWPPSWEDAFGKIDRINKLLAQQGGDSGKSTAYTRLDALAVEQLTKVRDTPRKTRFLVSLLVCMALALAAWVFQLGPLLLMLPVVVFVLLQLNERVRRRNPWKLAVYARSFAEFLRIREAANELGIPSVEIGQCFPRRDGERFLPPEFDS